MFNFFKESTIRILYTTLLLLGGVLIAWSIVLISYSKPETPFYRTTTGTVRSVQNISPRVFRIRVEFYLPNNSAVTAEAQYAADRAPLLGEKMLVHYNPFTPAEIDVKKQPRFTYQVIIFFGIMIGGLGFRFFIKSIFRNAKIDFIRENGKKIIPSEIKIEEHQIKIMWIIRIHALIICCGWKNPDDSTQLEFYSEPFPLVMRDKLNLHSARVFFIPQDPRRYFIHIDTGFDSRA